MKKIKYTILYCVCEKFCDSLVGTVIIYGSGSATAKSYGSYDSESGSGSATLPATGTGTGTGTFALTCYTGSFCCTRICPCRGHP
jgi:hypothetical protein